MLYPKVARIDCEDCVKHSYNLRTGKRNEYEGEDGTMLPILRTDSPPCKECPKKGPENAKRFELSFQARQMLDFYWRFKSNPNMRSRLLDCPLTQRNIRFVDNVYETARAKIMSRARRKAERQNRE